MTSLHDSAIEQLVVIAALVNPDDVDDMLAQVRPDHFHHRANAEAWEAYAAMRAKGIPADEFSTAMLAENMDAPVGYIDQLNDTIATLPYGYGWQRHAEALRAYYRRRQASKLYGEFGNEVLASQDVIDTLTKHAQAIIALTEDATVKDPRNIADFVAEAQEASKSGGVQGMMSPWGSLNNITTGWKPGQLIVTAAGTSVGKSAFASAVAAHHAETGVLVFSLEMTGREIASRMICCNAQVDSRLYDSGRLNREDRASADAAAAELRGNLWIDDSAGMNIAQLRSKASRWIAKHGISLVVVDYLGLVDEKIEGASRAVVVGAISRGLKLLAMECKVPVMALHQLNRDSAKEKREPQLHDLRDSGNIEQDADQVILLHRKERKEEQGIDIIKVKVAKNRGGPISSTELAFRRKFTRFEEIAHYEQPDDGKIEHAYRRDEDR